jgi:hypothetical protein
MPQKNCAEIDAKLSLVIPAFNEEGTVETVLDRVFESLPDVYEVIVVGDASTDDTAKVCRAYCSKEPRVRLQRHETNQGKTAALRTGFAVCSGSIVVVQDADLEYDPLGDCGPHRSDQRGCRGCLSGISFFGPASRPRPLFSTLFGKPVSYLHQ